jgi:hypothetical protein
MIDPECDAEEDDEGESQSFETRFPLSVLDFLFLAE